MTLALSASLRRESDGHETPITLSRASPEHSAGKYASEYHVHFTPKLSGWHELLCFDGSANLAFCSSSG